MILPVDGIEKNPPAEQFQSFLISRVQLSTFTMPTADEPKDSSHLPLFGLTVPLNSISESYVETDYAVRKCFRKRIPNAISDWSASPLMYRERHMITIMGQLTDKPDWKRKFLDEEIVNKWKKESIERWKNEPVEKQFSENMFDWVCD